MSAAGQAKHRKVYPGGEGGELRCPKRISLVLDISGRI